MGKVAKIISAKKDNKRKQVQLDKTQTETPQMQEIYTIKNKHAAYYCKYLITKKGGK